MIIYIKEHSWLARLAAAKLRSARVAIVFGNRIHLYNTSREEFLADPAWVCHELTHVQQYRQYGYAGFIVLYLLEWMKNGYHHNRFEAAARQQENARALLDTAVFR